jgi:hypothetical protein
MSGVFTKLQLPVGQLVVSTLVFFTIICSNPRFHVYDAAAEMPGESRF